MINLSQAITLDKLKVAMTSAKTYVDNRISALAQSVSDIMGDVNTSLETLEADMRTKGNCEILTFFDTVVPVGAWAADTTYSDYPFRASITCSGTTATHIPDIRFAPAERDSMNYSPDANTATNIVYIYAKTKPGASITIPTIELRKAVS